MANSKERKRTRKKLWLCILDHLLFALIVIVVCVLVYTAIYLNGCLREWKGEHFQVNSGICTSYFYNHAFTRAKTGWFFQVDGRKWFYIPCDVRNESDLQNNVTALSLGTSINICYMPSTFLRFNNMIVSMQVSNEELIPQDTVYGYLKDQKRGAVIASGLASLLLIVFLPGIIISDLELYQERHCSKKYNRNRK